MKQMEEMEVALTAKSEEVKEAVRDDMRAEHASKATLKKAVETMPTTVAQVASFFLPPHIFHRPYHSFLFLLLFPVLVSFLPLTQVVAQLPTLLISVFKNKWDDYSGEWSDWNTEGEVKFKNCLDISKNHLLKPSGQF